MMEAALADYVKLAESGLKLDEADWSKVRGLEFREALGHRDELASQLGSIEVDEEDFVSLVSDCSEFFEALTADDQLTWLISIRAYMLSEY